MPPSKDPRPVRPVRVVIVDDHVAMIRACETLLAHDHDVVATGQTGREALAAVAEHDPDVLVLDLELPDMTGLDVLRALERKSPRTAVVVLTLHNEPGIAARTRSLGALGFVTKSRMALDLLAALRAVAAGQPYCSPLTA